jgi:hypothetical protein
MQPGRGCAPRRRSLSRAAEAARFPGVQALPAQLAPTSATQPTPQGGKEQAAPGACAAVRQGAGNPRQAAPGACAAVGSRQRPAPTLVDELGQVSVELLCAGHGQAQAQRLQAHVQLSRHSALHARGQPARVRGGGVAGRHATCASAGHGAVGQGCGEAACRGGGPTQPGCESPRSSRRTPAWRLQGIQGGRQGRGAGACLPRAALMAATSCAWRPLVAASMTCQNSPTSAWICAPPRGREGGGGQRNAQRMKVASRAHRKRDEPGIPLQLQQHACCGTTRWAAIRTIQEGHTSPPRTPPPQTHTPSHGRKPGRSSGSPPAA